MKDLLLDTHSLIWFFNGDDQLSFNAKQKIEDGSLIKYVSIASFWEIAIKISLGKLHFSGGVKKVSKLIDQIVLKYYQSQLNK